MRLALNVANAAQLRAALKRFRSNIVIYYWKIAADNLIVVNDGRRRLSYASGTSVVVRPSPGKAANAASQKAAKEENMIVLKWISIALLALIGLGAAAFAWLIATRPDLSEFENYYARPAQSAVTVRFFGTSSMLFSDGETNIMIDGWFTRPSTLAMAFGKVDPDIAAIESGLARLGNSSVAALIPGHSHLDHAMDVAEVAKRTGAMLIGSQSTANIGRGGGLPEQQIKIVEDGETLRFGDFAVTMIENRHFVFPNDAFKEADPFIREPLTPPVPAYAYREGKTYSILIEHPGGSALVHASAGFKEDALRDVDVDVVYLGVGFLASQTAEYQEAYWGEVPTATRAEGVYVIHWDSFSQPIADIGDRPAAPNRLWNDLFGMRAGASVDYALNKAKASGIDAALLPMWEAVDAFTVAAPPREAAQ